MKKSELKTIIRTIVREEVAMAIKEVITELKKPVRSPMPQQKQVTNAIGKEINFVKDPVLNEVMKETAAADEWKTMGGGTFDSSKMNDVMSGQYGDMMNSNPNAPVTVDGKTADFLTKDYSGLMKAIDKKKGITNG